MKTNNNQKKQSGIHKQMKRLNKFLHLSLLAFAILLNHPSFSQAANDSISKGSVDSAGIYSNNKVISNPDGAKAKTDLEELESGYKGGSYSGDGKQYNSDRTVYGTFYAGEYECYHKSLNGQIEVSVPYTSTDQSGNTTKNTLVSSIANPFNQNKTTQYLLGLEIGFLSKYFASMEFSFGNNINYFSTGFGYQFNLGKSGIVIKPSVCIGGEENMEYKSDFGQLDNAGKTISILGYSSGTTFNYVSGGKYHQTQKEDDTQYLEVDYSQSSFVITPKIGIGNDQYEHRYHWEFDVAYNIMATDKGGLALTQYGPDASNQLNTKILGFGNGYTASCGNHAITSDPNLFNSLSIGLTVGWNINELTKHWGHSGC